MMVTSAWVLTILFSSPQALVFRVMKHPMKEFYQCTTYNFWESVSTPTKGPGNSTSLSLAGLSPRQWEDLYHTVFNCQVFFIPLIIITVSYVKIYILLYQVRISDNL